MSVDWRVQGGLTAESTRGRERVRTVLEVVLGVDHPEDHPDFRRGLTVGLDLPKFREGYDQSQLLTPRDIIDD